MKLSSAAHPRPKASSIPSDALPKIQEYVALLDKWRRVTNLISDRGFENVWSRQVLDSVQLFYMLEQTRIWLDLGSGAGFPAIVIAILLSNVPDAVVHGVEADRRKCAFLREVAEKLQLPLRIHNIRAEDLAPAETGPVEVVTARAFAGLPKILSLASDYLAEGCVAALPRGISWRREIESIPRDGYTVEVRPLPNPKHGAVVLITKRQCSISHDP